MQKVSRPTSLMKRLWRDEYGALGAGDYILMVTILGIGAVAGLATVRDAVVQDFGDGAIALETLNQSYTVSMTFATMDPDVTIVETFGYDDPPPDPSLADLPGEAPHGIEICDPPTGGESD